MFEKNWSGRAPARPVGNGQQPVAEPYREPKSFFRIFTQKIPYFSMIVRKLTIQRPRSFQRTCFQTELEYMVWAFVFFRKLQRFFSFFDLQKVLEEVKHTNSQTSRHDSSESYRNYICSYQKLQCCKQKKFLYAEIPR